MLDRSIVSDQEKLTELVEQRALRMVSDEYTEFELETARRISEQQILGRVAFHSYLDTLSTEV